MKSLECRRWGDLAWPELSKLDTSSTTTHEVGLVPLGATEQHGPHLPTATDSIVATAICDAAAQESGAIVLPTIAIGCSYGHGTLTPGTLSLTPELLAAVIRQYAEWASYSGLRRLLFVNAHLGNSSALGVATDHLRLYRPDLRVGVIEWWSVSDQVLAECTADGNDIHANRAETSLMMAVAPQLVHLDRCPNSDDPDRTANLVYRYTAPALSRNGVTGRPSEASAALGQSLLTAIVDRVVDKVQRGRTEQPPLGQAPKPGQIPHSQGSWR